MRLELARIALRNLWSSPVRSTLTVVGLGIGIGAIIAVLSVGKGGRAEIETQLNRLGINRVWVSADEGGELTPDDARLISSVVRGAAVSSTRSHAAQAKTGQKSANIHVIGCEAVKFEMDDIFIVSGAFVSSPDQRLAVVDEKAIEALGIAGVGSRVSLDGQMFIVTGVAEPQAIADPAASAFEGTVYVPLSTYASAFGRGAITAISVEAGGPPEQTTALVERLLTSRQNGRDGVRVTSMVKEAAVANRVMNIFLLVVLSVASICMFTGCIGVMNILLVSVRERRREIGILKAIGAKNTDIREQFLIESLGYAAGGCALGLLLGVGFTALASRLIGLDVAIGFGDVAIAALLTVTVGLLCGVWPASRAAALAPLEALRLTD